MLLHRLCVVCVFQNEVLTVFERVGLSSDEACNIVIGDSCGKGYDPWHQNWSVPIPGDKPPVVHHSPEVSVKGSIQSFFTGLNVWNEVLSVQFSEDNPPDFW